MRLGNRRTQLIALLVLAVVGGAGYLLGVCLWGKHHYQAALHALQQRDFQEASNRLDKCLSAWPNDAEVQLLAAQTARRRGDFEEATRRLRECSRKNPRAPIAREFQLLALQRGNLGEAEALLVQCLDRPAAPETPLTLEALIEGTLQTLSPGFLIPVTNPTPNGLVLLRWLKRAVALWLERCPAPADQAQGLAWRGRYHSLNYEYEKAEADLRRALELDPEHRRARLYLAALTVGRDPKKTLTHLRILHERDPGDVMIAIFLASTLHSLGRLEEARRILDGGLASRPDDVYYLLARGLVALDEQQLDAAERYLRRALEIAPNLPEIHVALSRCLRAAGKAAEAKQHQERFEQLEAQKNRASGPRGGG